MRAISALLLLIGIAVAVFGPDASRGPDRDAAVDDAALATDATMPAPASAGDAAPELLAGGAAPRSPIGIRQQEEEPYDGHYTFVRVRFGEGEGMNGFGGGGGWGRRREPNWAHDWDRAETHFLTILEELTYVSPTPGNGRIMQFDDPEIFRYPIAYVVEVGFWRPTQAEIDGLGAYLRKGGFLIVDDFRSNAELAQMQAILAAAVPGLRVQEVPNDHSIFDSFFRIEDPHALAPPTYQQFRPFYLGIFEDDDPYGRLMVMMNWNNDIAEYWETSGSGWALIDMENEAFKFGVNYVIYALTH